MKKGVKKVSGTISRDNFEKGVEKGVRDIFPDGAMGSMTIDTGKRCQEHFSGTFFFKKVSGTISR